MSNSNTIEFNAKYAEGMVSGVIGSLVGTENRLIKTQSKTMADLGITTMNSAQTQTSTTQVLGTLEGVTYIVGGAANLKSTYDNMMSAKELKGLKDTFNNNNNKIQTDINAVNTKLSKTDGMHVVKDPNNGFEKDGTTGKLKGDIRSTDQRNADLRERDDLMNKQKALSTQYEQDTKLASQNLNTKTGLIQAANQAGTGVGRILNSFGDSNRTIEGAKQNATKTSEDTIRNARDSGVQTVQGLTSVNMFSGFERLA